MQLDHIDKAIIRLLSDDGRSTYSDMARLVGVSVGTVRNRVTALRDSGALHLNIWLDPNKVGYGVNVTSLIKVRAGTLDDVTDALIDLESTGYVAIIAGEHDLIVDIFCRDVPHLNRVLKDEIQQIDGVVSVTSHLVTEIKYESKFNIADILENGEQPTRRSNPTT